MKKRTKEYLLIIGVFLIAAGAYFIVSNQRADTNIIEVRGRGDKVLKKLKIDQDGLYPVEVKNGTLTVEIKDDHYRVIDVDCPDKICEKEGWVEKGEINRIIHCLPNEVYIVQIES